MEDLHFPVLYFPPSDFTPNLVPHFPVLHFQRTLIAVRSYMQDMGVWRI